MGPLPITENGNEYIMVIGDYFTKWKESFALRDHTAQTVADVLITEFICRFGTPRRIHTDQGREFESTLFSEAWYIQDTYTVLHLIGLNPMGWWSDLIALYNKCYLSL